MPSETFPGLRFEGEIPRNIDFSFLCNSLSFQPTMPRQSVQTQDNLGEAIICTIGCDNNRFFLLDNRDFF